MAGLRSFDSPYRKETRLASRNLQANYEVRLAGVQREDDSLYRQVQSHIDLPNTQRTCQSMTNRSKGI